LKKNYLMAVITVLLWSSMAVIVKKIVGEIPNFETLFISGFFAFAFLLAVMVISGKIPVLLQYKRRELFTMGALGFLGLFLYSALYYYGISVLSSQVACILNYLWPMMIVMFSCLILKEPFTLRKIAAIVLSFAGVVVIAVSSASSEAAGPFSGIAACVLAAAFYGLFSVLNKKYSYDQTIMMMISWLVVALGGLIAGLLTEQWVSIRLSDWITLGCLGMLVDALAYLLWAKALNDSPDSAKIANLAYLVPVLSVILSSVVLGEKMGTAVTLAFVLIIAGIAIQLMPDETK